MVWGVAGATHQKESQKRDNTRYFDDFKEISGCFDFQTEGAALSYTAMIANSGGQGLGKKY
jgi:hypothetical protein